MPQNPADRYLSKYKTQANPADTYLSKYGPKEEKGPLAKVGEFASQAYAGLGDVAGRINLGALELLSHAPVIGERAGEAAEQFQQIMVEREAETVPESGAGTAGRVTGNIFGEGGQYLMGGGAIRKGAGAIARRVAPRVAAKLAGGGAVAQIAKDAASMAPVDVLTTAVGPENSVAGALAGVTESEILHKIAENPATRLAAEIGTGVAGDVLIRGLGAGVRRLAGPARAAKPFKPLGFDPTIADAPKLEGRPGAMGELGPTSLDAEIQRVADAPKAFNTTPELLDELYTVDAEIKGLGVDSPPESLEALSARRENVLAQMGERRKAQAEVPTGGERRGAAEPKLRTKTYEGAVGNEQHITRNDDGVIPTELLVGYRGARGEVRGAHTTRSGERFDELVEDIRQNGIKDPIFVTVEPNGLTQISEGNNRLDAAMKLGISEVPVEIRAFGHGERTSAIHQDLNRFSQDQRIGGAPAATVRTLAGAGVGAATGAALDEEDPRRGALVGGLAGAGIAGAGPAIVKRLGGKGPKLTNFADDPNVSAVSQGVSKGYSEKVGAGRTLKSMAKKTRAEISREVLPLEEYGRVVGDTEAVSEAAAQARGWVGTATQRVEDELIPIVKGARKAGLQDVRTLAYAERALELLDNGLEKSPYTREQLEATIQRLGSVEAVRKSADELQAYYKGLLEWKLDNAVISPEQYEKIRGKGLKYVPFIPEELEAGMGTAGGKLYNRGTGVRKMSGKASESVAVDPFEQAALDTMEASRTVGKQRVANVVTGIAEADPEKALPFLEKVKSWPVLDEEGGFVGWKHGAGERVIQVNRGGDPEFWKVNDEDLFDAWAAMDGPMSNIMVESLNKARQAFQASITGHPAFLVVNGIRDFLVSGAQYPLKGGVRGLAGATLAGAGVGAALDEEDRVGGALKGASIAASTLGGIHVTQHIGRTLNALTDILGPEIVGGVAGGIGGAVSADEDQSEFLRFLSGAAIGAGVGGGARVVGLKGNKEAYREFMKEGGGGFGYYARTPKAAQRMIQEQLRGGFKADDIINPRSWWDAVQYVSRAVETAPRLARYKHLRKAGESVGASIFNARDLSLDFSVKGGSTKTVSKMVPFLNPAIQGGDKLVRLLADKDTWPVAFATIAAPTLGLWAMIHADDETAQDYQARPLYERNTYWHIPKKWFGEDEGFYKIPKPFEVGALFASLPERLLDYRYHQDPETLKQALKEMSGQYGPGNFFGLPVGFDVAFEVTTGEHGFDRFRRREINPYPWKEIPSELQFDERTSTPALLAGRALGRSPAKIDHLLKGMTGTIGTEVLDRVTQAARKMGVDPRGQPTRPSRPVFARLHTTPTTIPEQERAFRRKWAKAEEAYNGVSQALDAGNQDEAERLAKRYQSDLLAYGELKVTADVLAEIGDVRRALWDTKDLDDKKRRAAIAKLNRNIASWLTSLRTQPVLGDERSEE
ncbi:MAG: ParB N-terminal domain-containing protein [Anaerolineales bacterium]|nr:ParB N-terminal domain-containing protein [Anaerolineales bacterium]